MYKTDLLNFQKDNWIYSVLLFPLIILFLFFSISTYYLLFFKHLSKFVFIFSYILAELFLFMLNPKKFIQSFVCSTIILFITIYSTTFVYDYTWDGNSYHKLCTGLIKEGWNPVKETITTAIGRNNIFAAGTALNPFYDGYPKASYLIAATVYAFTENIETGKVYTLLALISAFAIIFNTSKKALKTSILGSIMIAFSLCCTPVVFSQLYTYYNDGLLHLMFFIACAELMVIYNQEHLTLDHFLVAISIIIAVNLKYSAIIIMTIPCFFYLVFIIFKHPRKLKSTIIFFLCIIFSALIVLGLTSYVHNIIFHHNPFYTLIGKGKEDVFSDSIPKAYKSIPNILRLVFSIFSPVSNNHYTEEILLKIPFTITKDSLNDMIFGNDIRMGGWGIFFSGIFILSILAFIYRIIKYKFDKFEWSFIIITISTFLPAFFLNCLNNARYWPFVFLYSSYLIIAFEKEMNVPKKITTFCKYCLFILILLNTAIPALSNIYLAKKTWNTKKQYKSLVLVYKDNRDLYFDFSGLIYNLHDNHIFVKQKALLESVKPENLVPYVDYYLGSIFIESIE